MGKNARMVRETLNSNGEQRPILSMSMYKDCFLVALESMRNPEISEELSWAQILQEKLEQLDIHINDYDNLDELNYAILGYEEEQLDWDEDDIWDGIDNDDY